jgi:hypothetical protein
MPLDCLAVAMELVALLAFFVPFTNSKRVGSEAGLVKVTKRPFAIVLVFAYEAAIFAATKLVRSSEYTPSYIGAPLLTTTLVGLSAVTTRPPGSYVFDDSRKHSTDPFESDRRSFYHIPLTYCWIDKRWHVLPVEPEFLERSDGLTRSRRGSGGR